MKYQENSTLKVGKLVLVCKTLTARVFKLCKDMLALSFAKILAEVKSPTYDEFA